ncbi:MAG TPA: glycosyltransferase family 4 protein [Candidatus Angelobacter sp.]|nr:glycosyltransferase family 4 protein [Candidatus Angelobacter sp.]
MKHKPLRGKRAAIVVLSSYPADPRPRRSADALVRQGMQVDYICAADGKSPRREKINGLNVFRVPIQHRRGGKFGYAWEYSAFTLASAAILAARSLRHRYDLVFINNMPDVLVASALLSKMFGAKVILDLHDPMPELMMAIFRKDSESKSVRFLKFLEKWSVARADHLLVPDAACHRALAARTRADEKISVIMNSPDESLFSFVPARARPLHGNKPFVAMYHGTLVERNGLQIAIDALARLRDRLPTAQLHIYGKATPFLERVMQSVRERALQNNVLHLGEKSLEQIAAAIDACDIGIVPNPRNAFTELNMPTRIFEYLARGKPVIAARTAGIQDYFNEESLLFFEAGSPDDLAKKIEFAVSSPMEVLAITGRGQQVYQTHTWKQESQALVRVVQKLLEPQEHTKTVGAALPALETKEIDD